MAYVADLVRPEHRAASFGLILCSFSVGILVGPLGGGYISPPVASVAALAGLLFCVLYVALLVPESSTPEARQKVRSLTFWLFCWSPSDQERSMNSLRCDYKACSFEQVAESTGILMLLNMRNLGNAAGIIIISRLHTHVFTLPTWSTFALWTAAADAAETVTFPITWLDILHSHKHLAKWLEKIFMCGRVSLGFLQGSTSDSTGSKAFLGWCRPGICRMRSLCTWKVLGMALQFWADPGCSSSWPSQWWLAVLSLRACEFSINFRNQIAVTCEGLVLTRLYNSLKLGNSLLVWRDTGSMTLSSACIAFYSIRIALQSFLKWFLKWCQAACSKSVHYADDLYRRNAILFSMVLLLLGLQTMER